MRLRGVVLAIGGAEALLWLLVAANGLLSRSDPATRGLDTAAALIATGIFAVSGLPALVLAFKNRGLRFAFVLALLPVVTLVVAILVWGAF
ncbi:hypothetical protein [Phreatobacter stygius]|uniref:Uncharacterized protein n=1 Tax=Phreatobacter stygius TaxID=1940610 RepID=A0A4D7B6D8_9HYPH|nr:hypothetical protein [Phreatobacter stygius]QCI65938.1 hypothetical protein E8M01_18015 [Phreatobacter stygius]